MARDVNWRLSVKPFGNKPKNDRNNHSKVPYCGANVNLQSAPRVAAANTAFEASEMLKKLKNEKGFNHKP